MADRNNEEDRRFQIELVKTEVDLLNQMALIIGVIVIEIALFIYYGETKLVMLQFIIGILMILTIFPVLPLGYFLVRRYRFKHLEEQFVTKKPETQAEKRMNEEKKIYVIGVTCPKCHKYSKIGKAFSYVELEEIPCPKCGFIENDKEPELSFIWHIRTKV